jgi:hypothetical protein
VLIAAHLKKYITINPIYEYLQFINNKLYFGYLPCYRFPNNMIVYKMKAQHLIERWIYFARNHRTYVPGSLPFCTLLAFVFFVAFLSSIICFSFLFRALLGVILTITRMSKHEEACFKFRDEIAKMKGMTDTIAANSNTIKTLLASNEQCNDDIRVIFFF